LAVLEAKLRMRSLHVLLMDKMADSDLVSEPGPSLSESSACSR